MFFELTFKRIILNYKKIIGIILISSSLGILINHFNPAGIPLIREKTELKWASDSLLFQSGTDSVKIISDTISIQSEIQPIEKKELIKENKKKDELTENKSDQNKNQVESAGFSEPKAITLVQAKTLFDKSVQFIDARDEADYSAGHIVNSINIPFDDFENHKQKLNDLSKEKPYVIYCAGTECDLSILLGNKMFELGYKQLYIFFGGWVDWQNANYPIEHNSN